MKSTTGKHYSLWWGPPKKISNLTEDRKVTWLELFYDLVYVIVISRSTHYLALDPEMHRVIDYSLLFTMIFWGWLNGSMYYDLHGSPGIRTRFMMLWQMMAVAALAVVLGNSTETNMTYLLITFIFLQVFITYLWWSVGLYDKQHRKLNKPFTVCYLFALAFICLTLFVSQPFKRVIFAISLVFNYLPSFLSQASPEMKLNAPDISPRMVERLGLFTIIVFGEVILGVINGSGTSPNMGTELWYCFALSILLVFALWWIFFSLVADKEVREGFLHGRIMTLVYIPALASLGMVGATFNGLITGLVGFPLPPHFFTAKILFGLSLSVFLISICAISRFLKYPPGFENAHRVLIPLIIAGAMVIPAITVLLTNLSLIIYLLIIFCILSVIIIVITWLWYKVEVGKLVNL